MGLAADSRSGSETTSPEVKLSVSARGELKFLSDTYLMLLFPFLPNPEKTACEEEGKSWE